MLCQRLVLTTPGDTALTRIGANSIANARVKASIVPQTLAATTHPLCGRWPAIPVVRTIEPPSRICGLPYLTAASAAQYRNSKAGLFEIGRCKVVQVQAIAGGENQVIESTEPG